MDLVNGSPYPAGLNRTVIDDTRFAASVLCRVAYDLEGETLAPSAVQPWLVSAAPWTCEYGAMDSDEVFYKGGVDLLVFGHARAPGGRSTARLDVSIEVTGADPFERRITVFGDRVWERRRRQLVPGPPLPFEAIALTLANAYGGKDRWDGLDVPFSDNPTGKGYYLEEAAAEGRPLPNLEDPDQVIERWDDRPEPVGVGACPMDCGLRVRNSVVFDDQGNLKEIKPQFFNAAFPRMILPRVQPGDRLRLTGVSESGPLAFAIPRHDLAVRLCFDRQVIERPLAIDQVGIEVDKGRVFIAYRYPFRYVLHPLQKRSCELLERAASAPRRLDPPAASGSGSSGAASSSAP